MSRCNRILLPVIVGIALSAILLIVASCSGGRNGAGTASEASDSVELTIYLMGNEPRDYEVVESELNRLSLAELGCRADYHFTTWSDYMQRYNLLLSSGQPIDLMFTSDWLNFNQFARKGAFRELDALLPEHAPELHAFVGDDFWDAIRVNGKIFTIPATWKEYVGNGVLYREDLRKQYDLPIPDSLQNIEFYLAGTKAAEPERSLTTEMVADLGFGPFFTAIAVLDMKYRWVDISMPYGLTADYDDPDDLRIYWESQDFIEDMKMFKRWADQGFWSKSVLSDNNSQNDSFLNDNAVILLQGQNPMKFVTMLSLMKSSYPGREVEYYPYCRSTGLVKPVHPIHNGMAIPLHSPNPEYALKYYEKLVLDRTWNHLSHYGILGTHYRIDDDGYYRMIGDSQTNGFTREAMNSWAWRNPDLILYDRSFRKAQDLFEEFDRYAQPDIYLGFVEDYSEYQAERTALYQVQSQYLLPIQAGLVEDVEEAVAEFLHRAYDAGLEKIHKGYTEQWLAYCREKGLDA